MGVILQRARSLYTCALQDVVHSFCALVATSKEGSKTAISALSQWLHLMIATGLIRGSQEEIQ